MKGKVVFRHYIFSLALLFVGFQVSVQRRLLSISKPDPDDAAATARWLVSQNSWGVLNTISSDLGGSPFGNVVSFSDGIPGKGLGIPYFYLTTLDPTARNALKDPRSSLTISEYPIGTCGKNDPENPTCAKITLTGKLNLVEGNSDEAEFAQSALFTKHPEMKDWPKGHNFQFFKLEIEDIFLIDWFGGPKPLTLDQYLHPNIKRSKDSKLMIKPKEESTISNDLGGAPFGNVVSFSDGLPDNGLGIPYFYLTTLDPTASNALIDPRSSFAISEYPLGTCRNLDPENPTCAKITLTGKLKLVDGNSTEAEFAQSALFSKHPEMRDWPKDHHFQFFALEIEDIFLINAFGGPKPLTVYEYLHPKI
ncbi:hypothetical protein L1049_002362 [Liquidambar formosana]|uniref:CREG-like beta-barrel domain-containing protein n=1 Tax=Liquidambar formosana TaxID=63359 RepID=A0AAP0R8T8_LIQFO